jgi:hypothetical protein
VKSAVKTSFESVKKRTIVRPFKTQTGSDKTSQFFLGIKVVLSVKNLLSKESFHHLKKNLFKQFLSKTSPTTSSGPRKKTEAIFFSVRSSYLKL